MQLALDSRTDENMRGVAVYTMSGRCMTLAARRHTPVESIIRECLFFMELGLHHNAYTTQGLEQLGSFEHLPANEIVTLSLVLNDL